MTRSPIELFWTAKNKHPVEDSFVLNVILSSFSLSLSSTPHFRLQSRVDGRPEEHWLLSAQDSWKTSSTSILVLALLSTLLFLLIVSAIAKIVKHLFRYFVPYTL